MSQPGRPSQSLSLKAAGENTSHRIVSTRSNNRRSYDGFVINGVILHRGRPIPIPEDVRSRFVDGDQLFVADDGDVLHVPAQVSAEVADCVARARRASSALNEVPDESIQQFFLRSAELLASSEVRERLIAVNQEDVHRAQQAGRSTARLVLDEAMLRAMVESFRIWADHPIQRDVVVERVDHEGWTVSRTLAPLGVVGFVFEGRPNVVVDACGVLVTGNTCVFRIGRDARRTASEILSLVVEPALAETSLPTDSVVLIPLDDHASGWSLFSQPEVSLAVARGSGKAVQDLGSVARQSGVPVSLHGRGGAWFLVGESADRDRLLSTLRYSLDRKVCNTANVVVLPRKLSDELFPIVVRALQEAAAARDAKGIIHVISEDGDRFLSTDSKIPGVDVVPAQRHDLSTEWEWENDPEITVCFVDEIDEAFDLFNEFSPRLVASIISEEESDHRRGWQRLSCPFVGDGFSRWVDGQFAFRRPELGLSNWEGGVPLGRGAILSGSDIHSVRYRVTQRDPKLHR